MTRIALTLTLLCLAAPVVAVAEEPTQVEVIIKDHRFAPAEIHVPAGKPAIITVRNQDGTAEEFDSTALKVEKVVAGGGYGTVRLRPLAAGRYPFIGEYHADTAQGVVIADK
jgi:hypothetical protein